MFDLENVVDNQTAAEELEEVVMGLIINSGQARSLAYGALRKAKEGDFEAAKAMMDQSRIALNEAHLVQTKLIEGDQGEGKNESQSGPGSRSGSFDDLNAGS
ncbi:PTS system N,N'-diacetylchitobiose-specific transporter subunit IIA [Salmonella enterica subsp. enterica serovar Agona str. SA-1]|nr:PTS system N,N'-diacetylchitobiose-specific transporter subunit IIA [Salmonella enterica subsp. enterica serovar Agona str. SA-1]